MEWLTAVLALFVLVLVVLLVVLQLRSRHLRKMRDCADKKHEEDLRRLIDYDELTGLYGRRTFYKHVRAVLNENPGKRYVMVRGDINRFKTFNDIFGTMAGDRLLGELGAFLSASAAEGTVICRMQADHFVSFWEEDRFHLTAAMDRLTQWFERYPVEFGFSFCLGLYTIDDPAIDVALMCDRTLLALYTVKGNYGNKYAYYNTELRKKLMLEQSIVSGMNGALAGDQFEVYFQPQYSYQTGSIIGAEALVRWNHPQLGFISPSVFVPIFEGNGLITTLDHCVWAQVCRHIRRWMDRGDDLHVVPISVNISRRDIYDDNLCGHLKHLIDQYDIPVALLRLEITESAYVENPHQLIDTVKQLQEAGFVVEMDDFGSGYSSLNTLKDVPVNVLKLDLKFMQGEDSARGGNILSSVVRMARWLELPIIAEGVETRKQADFLKTIGCEYMQGYFFAKPMPAQAFEALLLSASVTRLDNSKIESDLIDASEFWNPDSQMTLIFNSFVGGAAIVEYGSGRVEALRLNDNFLDVVRMNRAEYEPYRKNMLERFDTEGRARFMQMLDHAIEIGGEAECEVHTRPTQAYRSGLYNRIRVRLIARFKDSYLFYILIEDVTDKRMLAQQLDAIMDSVPGGIALYEISTSGVRTIYFNDAVPLLSGHTHDEYQALAAEDATVMVWPEDLPAVALEIQRMALGQSDKCVCPYRIHHKDGSFRWVRLSATMMRRDDGVTMASASFIDITEEREAVNLSAQQHRLLYNLYNTAPCAIIQYRPDAQAEATFINQTACDILGYENSADFLLTTGGSVGKCVCAEDQARWQSVLAQAMAESAVISCELKVLCKNGALRRIRTSIKRTSEHDGSATIQSAFVDISADYTRGQ